jgi:hypothetical protein
MERTPGYWAFYGVDREDGTLLGGPSFTPNNKGCIVKIWSCPVCKIVSAYADDTED